MKVEILEKGEDWIKLKVSGIDYALANAIRRSSYEIYMPAVDELEVYTNDSVLYDEILANRLGLIPLVPKREINAREECSCKGKGCSKCTLKIKIEEKGQKGGNMVYASAIKGEAEALFKEMPIVWLEEGQELKIVATVTLGKAIEHAKYQAGLLVYNPVFILKNFDKEISSKEEIKSILEKFGIRLEKNAELDEKQYEILTYLQEKYNAKFDLEVSQTDFVFYIETFSYLKPIEIFVKAIDALRENLEKFLKEIKSK
jgi:DNA-directed RNA polymerase subunit D